MAGLRDVDAAIAEIAHGCERLEVAGFTLLTHFGGTYLGDAAFEPVFRELDRRKARVFIHPTSPPCWERTPVGRDREGSLYATVGVPAGRAPTRGYAPDPP